MDTLFSGSQHKPAVTRSIDDEWEVFCPACSEAAGRLVQTCLIEKDWPPLVLVDAYYRRTLLRLSHNARLGGAALSRRATDTQRSAAAAILPKSGTIQAGILDLITRAGDAGMTDAEIEHRSRLSHQTASAARNALMNKGLIRDSGLRRKNPNGNDVIAWVRVHV